MHVLVTANAAWNLVNFRRGLIAALQQDGHRVTVLAPPDGALDRLREMGCAVVALDMDRKGMSPLRDGLLALRFVRHLRALRPDVVLGYTIKNNVFGALAARLLGIPFLPNVTGLGTAFLSGSWLQRLVERLYRVAFAQVPLVFFQNEDDRDLFLSRRLVRPGQVRLLPGSGIDPGHFTPCALPGSTAEGVTFLLIGRVLRDKGVVEYAEAAAALRRDHPNARFRLLGPMGAENRTAIAPDTVRAWQESGAVDYLGARDDVRPEIAAADCVVLPSYREGMPRSLLEAGAMARPVVATDVPGCRHVVVDGETGLLCRARDAASLRDAMARVIAMPPEARMAMGRAGRARVEAVYDEARVISAYRAALADISAGAR
jgi:glycosyltransferase involved in cell wall biosynthesis